MQRHWPTAVSHAMNFCIGAMITSIKMSPSVNHALNSSYTACLSSQIFNQSQYGTWSLHCILHSPVLVVPFILSEDLISIGVPFSLCLIFEG
ncbi:hypothetical protein C8Q75DRAFT_767639 [Abortiporus biennis]|nr:hypothetical protein C8Q75DRAFT_767639 [Abortiporus biennis]